MDTIMPRVKAKRTRTQVERPFEELIVYLPSKTLPGVQTLLGPCLYHFGRIQLQWLREVQYDHDPQNPPVALLMGLKASLQYLRSRGVSVPAGATLGDVRKATLEQHRKTASGIIKRCRSDVHHLPYERDLKDMVTSFQGMQALLRHVQLEQLRISLIEIFLLLSARVLRGQREYRALVDQTRWKGTNGRFLLHAQYFVEDMLQYSSKNIHVCLYALRAR